MMNDITYDVTLWTPILAIVDESCLVKVLDVIRLIFLVAPEVSIDLLNWDIKKEKSSERLVICTACESGGEFA